MWPDGRGEHLAQEQIGHYTQPHGEEQHVHEQPQERKPAHDGHVHVRVDLQVEERGHGRQGDAAAEARDHQGPDPAQPVADEADERVRHGQQPRKDHRRVTARHVATGLLEDVLRVDDDGVDAAQLLGHPREICDEQRLAVALDSKQVFERGLLRHLPLHVLPQLLQLALHVPHLPQETQRVSGAFRVAPHQVEVGSFRHPDERGEERDGDGYHAEGRGADRRVKPHGVDDELPDEHEEHHGVAPNPPHFRRRDLGYVDGDDRKDAGVRDAVDEPGDVEDVYAPRESHD